MLGLLRSNTYPAFSGSSGWIIVSAMMATEQLAIYPSDSRWVFAIGCENLHNMRIREREKGWEILVGKTEVQNDVAAGTGEIGSRAAFHPASPRKREITMYSVLYCQLCVPCVPCRR